MGLKHKNDKFQLQKGKSIGKIKAVPLPIVVIEQHPDEESEHRNNASKCSRVHSDILTNQNNFFEHSKPSRILRRARALSEISMESLYFSSDDATASSDKSGQPPSLYGEQSSQTSDIEAFSRCALPPGRPLQAAPKLVTASFGSTLFDASTNLIRQKMPSLKSQNALPTVCKIPCPSVC